MVKERSMNLFKRLNKILKPARIGKSLLVRTLSSSLLGLRFGLFSVSTPELLLETTPSKGKFPKPSQKIMTSTSKFSIDITEIESVDLRLKPTTELNEHLLVEGNTVSIFKVSIEDIGMLHTYAKNRAAIALGIESLGKEVLSSLKALYIEDGSLTRAESLGLFAPRSEVDRILMETALRNCVNTRPEALICRAHASKKLIDHRRSWLPSLVRDMKKQFQTQPLLFYGAILVAFFGVCTMIQTVTSIWSLALTLRATK